MGYYAKFFTFYTYKNRVEGPLRIFAVSPLRVLFIRRKELPRLMNDILDELAPVKSMRVRDKDVPYMTSKWKSAIRAKRKATSNYT